MRKKTIGILVVAVTLVASVSVAAVQAQTYAQPPKVTPITGKTKVKKKVAVATITCGSPGTCTTTASSAKIKANGESFIGKVIAATVGTGQSITAKVKVSKAARAAVAAAGKGKVKWSITEHSSNGLNATGSGKRGLKT